MAKQMTEFETEQLLSAETELFKDGKTDIRCPRCRNKLIIEHCGKTTHKIKCASLDCLIITFRGI